MGAEPAILMQRCATCTFLSSATVASFFEKEVRSTHVIDTHSVAGRVGGGSPATVHSSIALRDTYGAATGCHGRVSCCYAYEMVFVWNARKGCVPGAGASKAHRHRGPGCASHPYRLAAAYKCRHWRACGTFLLFYGSLSWMMPPCTAVMLCSQRALAGFGGSGLLLRHPCSCFRPVRHGHEGHNQHEYRRLMYVWLLRRRQQGFRSMVDNSAALGRAGADAFVMASRRRQCQLLSTAERARGMGGSAVLQPERFVACSGSGVGAWSRPS
eukprot:366199-Chlamydomonas_euryale.AAC.16